MVSTWLNITLLICIQCLVFTAQAADEPTISINGNSSTRQILTFGDIVTITCTVASSYIIDSFYLQRNGYNYKNLGTSSHTADKNITIVCDDDDTYFRCYGYLNKSKSYSDKIYVTANCPPNWAESLEEPVVFASAPAENTYFDIKIIGHPKPAYSVQKFTSTGLQDLSAIIDIFTYTYKVKLYFRSYSAKSHGVYRLVGNNSEGNFTANITLRGNPLPPKNVIAWSSSPNSIQLQWNSGDEYKTKQRYFVYSKEVTWGSPVTVYDLGSTVTYIFSTDKPNTTYYFLVSVKTEYGSSGYSNMAQATSLSPGEPPQTKPVYHPTEPTPQTCQERPSICPVCEQDFLTFEIGIGVGIGLILVIVVIGTVMFFKRSSTKGDEIPVETRNDEHESESEGAYVMYEQIPDTKRGTY